MGWSTFWAIFSKQYGHPEAEQPMYVLLQCDQIERNFAIWAKFSALGAFLSEKCLPNVLGAIFFKKNFAPNSH
jgi:hypothetical protein